MDRSSAEVFDLPGRGVRSTATVAGSGPSVLCLHGFPDDSGSFRHQIPALADAGFRVVCPVMRGYEPSSQPGPENHHYHPVEVARDVVAWAERLGPGPIHLVGHDWGAVVGYLAAGIAPERFRTLATIAVPTLQGLLASALRVPVQLRNSWYIFYFQLRGIADRAVERDDFAFIERLWRDWSPGWAWPPEAMESVKRTFRSPGVLRSALGYYRALLDPFHPDAKLMRKLGYGRIGVPTLAITGAKDGCLDTRIFDHIDRDLFPKGFHVERLSHVGHFAHQEDPETVNALLLEWLRAASG